MQILVIALFILLVSVFLFIIKKQKNAHLQYIDVLQNRLFEMDKINKRLEKQNYDFNISQEISNIGTWEIGDIKSIPFWSKQTYKIFGKDKDIFIPDYRDVIQLFHHSDRRAMNKKFFDSIEEKKDFSVTGKIYHENGFLYYVEVKGRHIYDHEGVRVRSVGSLMDVTERVQLANVLKQMNRNLDERVDQEIEKNKLQQEELFRHSRMAQMGEMLAMIAHQWRQPLGAISSISIDLNMKLELESFDLQNKKSVQECQEYFTNSLADINSLIDGLSSTIDDFRNFYRPDKKVKLCQINEPVKKALKIIKASCDANSIKVVTDFQSSQKIEIFDGELIQVVLNILQNAQDNFLDRNVPSAQINIHTYDKDEYTTVLIEDNGGGIKEEILDKIFDPYYSTKNEKNGTGLGLYMSKIIINEHHDGIIKVQNNKSGVSFMINLKKSKESKNEN